MADANQGRLSCGFIFYKFYPLEIYKCTSNEFEFLKLQNILQIGKKKTDLLINCKNYFPVRDVTKTGSGERGTEVWQRVVSGNLHKNPKWPSKKRERERRRQRKEFVPWLKSGGDEIANQTPILRLRFEQVVCFFDIQPVSFTI